MGFIYGLCLPNSFLNCNDSLWFGSVNMLSLFVLQDSSQIELLKELLDLLKDMVVMLLSLLEGCFFSTLLLLLWN